MGSEPRLPPIPQIAATLGPDPLREAGEELASSWVLVGSVSAVPQQEL